MTKTVHALKTGFEKNYNWEKPLRNLNIDFNCFQTLPLLPGTAWTHRLDIF